MNDYFNKSLNSKYRKYLKNSGLQNGKRNYIQFTIICVKKKPRKIKRYLKRY